jgi:hypothetical protein
MVAANTLVHHLAFSLDAFNVSSAPRWAQG